MNKYKMIFSDIDGTLLNSNHKITERTKKSIKKLEKIKVPFVLVSARMPKGIYTIQNELDIKSPIVCYSGGLVIDSNKKVIFNAGIKIDEAIEIKSYIASKWKEVTISCYSDDEWIVDDSENEWIVQESDITLIKPTIGRLKEVYCKDSVVHKILCMGDPDLINEVNNDVKRKYSELSIYKSKDTYLEIMDKNASKSNAMRILCESLNIKIDEVISIGDNYNDMDMIKTAGRGIAMENAPDEVKKISNEITKSNDEDGVVEIIRKYFH